MKPDGGPAFPHFPRLTANSIGPNTASQDGMSLRDYFAAAALTAMTSLHPVYATGPDSATAARRAYELADAMLAERGKQP